MRFVVYGAGAVGGVIGGRLHQAGFDVALIARGRHLDILRRDGLTLVGYEGVSQLPVTAVGHPRELELTADDVVLLTMKTQHTEAALEDLRRSTDLDLPIVCAQNGVENERLAARRFGRVYAMLVWLPASFMEPGRVVAYAAPKHGLLDLGRYPRGCDAVAAEIASAIEASGFACRCDPDVLRMKHYKLLTNLMNAVVATLGHLPDFGDLPSRIRDEALACFEAAGIDCATAEEEGERRAASQVRIVDIEGESRKLGSSWQSLARGAGSIETDFLNGEISLLGTQYGVPTPCNRALQITANRLCARGEKPGAISLDEVNALVRSLEAQGPD